MQSSNINENMKKSGERAWIYWTNKPLFDTKGNFKGILSVGNDITELKRIQEELKQKENTLECIFIAAPVAICLAHDRIIKWTNFRMSEITGYTIEELVNNSTRFLYLSEDEFNRVGNILYDKFSEKDFKEIETKWKRKDDEIIDVFIRISPLDISNPDSGYITAIMDITNRKKAQKQLGENLEYFAHLVDHIRNPLAIMSGFIQVEVENEKTKARLIRQIDRIEELIKQLDRGWMDTEETRKFLKKYF